MVRNHLEHALSFAACADERAFDSNVAEYQFGKGNGDFGRLWKLSVASHRP